MTGSDNAKMTFNLEIQGRTPDGYTNGDRVVFYNEDCADGQVKVLVCGHHDVVVDVNVADLEKLTRMLEWIKSA